jgi:hypothetical protein
MSEETIDVLCHHCGQAFSAFLHQMADKNAKVVCPNCRKDDCRPAKAESNAARTAETRTSKKII